MTKASATDSKTFEQALQELEGLVNKLESGDVPLKDTVDAVAQGQQLIKFCRAELALAETKITELDQLATEDSHDD